MRASEFLPESVSTGQGGGSAGGNGGQMVGGPTTYEQEYNMFKRKGQRRITAMTNEALDSSYEYRNSKQIPGTVFYFDADDGTEYKVQFGKSGKAVEVAFFARGEGDEHKIGLTGSGDSRKIFGTVINIVKDYMEKNNPMTLLFTANNSEQSRVKLYNMLASKVDQALPDYTFQGAFNNGNFTQFNIIHKDSGRSVALDKAKAKAGKALDKVFEDKITLSDIYKNNYPDHDEVIWNYVGDSDFDIPFTIQTINPNKLNIYLTSQYSIEHIEELFDMMDEDQKETVEHYENDPTLSDQIIVMSDGRIIDGNHRALAAVLSNRPIKYIDVSEEEV